MIKIPDIISNRNVEYQQEDNDYNNDTIVLDTSDVFGNSYMEENTGNEEEGTHNQDKAPGDNEYIPPFPTPTPMPPWDPFDELSSNSGAPEALRSQHTSQPNLTRTNQDKSEGEAIVVGSSTPVMVPQDHDRGKGKGKKSLREPESSSQVPLTIEPKKKSAKITSDINRGNILLEGSTRMRRGRRQEAMAILAGKDIIEEDVRNQAFYSAFIASAKTNITRIKISDLPKEPTNWREFKAYPKKAEFFSACREELRELDQKGTFKVIPEGVKEEIDNISLLPLM